MITPRNHVAITHRPASSYAATGQGHKSVNNLTEFSYSHRESQTHDLLIAGPMLHQFGHCLKAVLEKRVLNGHSVVVAVISYNDNKTHTHTHTHTHPFNGTLSGTTRVGQYQKGKTNLDFTEARDSEWQ